MVQLIILNLFRNMRFREMMGVPRFLPGTKLYRLNVGTGGNDVIKQPYTLKKPAMKKKK